VTYGIIGITRTILCMHPNSIHSGIISKVRDVDLLKFSVVSNASKPVHTWFSVSQKTDVHVFLLFFSRAFFVAKWYILQQMFVWRDEYELSY